MTLLHTILAFLFALGLLVTIHEFGHFWVAKKLGVKILRFSVGFGKPFFSRRFGADKTEFALATIPLGGYVKMLDEREGKVAPYERHRAFNNQPVSTRIAIVVAGPLFNFLFAILAYWLMMVIGISGMKPMIGSVLEDSPAASSQLQAGSEIISMGGEPTPTWSAFVQKTIHQIMDAESVEIVTQHKNGAEQHHVLDMSSIHVDDLSKGDLLKNLGLEPYRLPVPAVIDRIIEGGAAQKAGLLVGDKILSADGVAVNSWFDWVRYVQDRPDQEIITRVERDSLVEILKITPAASGDKGKQIGKIGAAVKPITLDQKYIGVEKYTPFEALTKATQKTWDMSILTLKLMGKIVTGEASFKNLSGPISIAEYAGKTATIGLTAFLSFLALVSISLGVLNLLPIPLLDGGHLLYYLIEILIGKPVSESVQLIGQQVGILFLVALMSVAFYNDIMRLLS